MERWANRVALVTGASVGIGAAISKLLCQNGMKVVGCARRVEKIQEIKDDGFPTLYPYKVSYFHISSKNSILKSPKKNHFKI